MKFIQETALIIFSILILIISILSITIVLGWLDFGIINNIVDGIVGNTNYTNVILVLDTILIALALVSIFYDENKSSGTKDGILLENEKGNLLISKSALIKIINGVVNEFESVKVDDTRIQLDKEGKLHIDIQINVTKDVIIKEVTSNIQTKVEESIKKSSDLAVDKVNVGIHNVIESSNTELQA